jgi:ring-1,2-phenylacetyl-CoA epoxidase subunit PaaC
MDKIDDKLKKPFIDLLLSVADDKLMMGHRNADWTGLGPILEEDIAFSALAQDEIAHASAIYELIGALTGKSADDIAFGRKPSEYRCASLVEQPDDFDWAVAITQRLFVDHLDAFRWQRLANSTATTLAELAGRIRAEETVHTEHVDDWVMHLGKGTPESKQRMQRAIDRLWGDAMMLFEPVAEQEVIEKAGLYPVIDPPMHEQWLEVVSRAIVGAGLTLPAATGVAGSGGRTGHHSPHFEALLEEMCEVYRIEPEAKW